MAGVLQFVHFTYGGGLFVWDYLYILSVSCVEKMEKVITSETQLWFLNF